MAQIIFQTRQEYLQSAFNDIAKIISDHGRPTLDAFVPAFSTQKCLSHLALVCYEWSYDHSLIDAYLETYKAANKELQENMGDC
ncbi:hypothetical protein SAMN05421749_10250 [Acinetobacter marinus]|uniref:Uncharacterized protein n=1 Tax=Acinetobacter marinus TaxID=281375 RepID=A0A1G6HB65_9GAMM|nr:hypothetical protein [Acinetobacter marinus]SDB91500.1 hypothetical protein SAMN05421749_10250 [Acinetobacter marinus]